MSSVEYDNAQRGVPFKQDQVEEESAPWPHPKFPLNSASSTQ
jgi:hypothetical protein